MSVAADAPARPRRWRKPRSPLSRRRPLEFFLLLVVLAISGLGAALVGFGLHDTLPGNFWGTLGLFGALYLAAHIALRVLAPQANQLLLPIAGFLNAIGYFTILRLTLDEQVAEAGGRSLAGQQALWMVTGVGGFAATLFVLRKGVRVLDRYRYTFLFAGLVLILSPLLPGLGFAVNGARLWIDLGPISFQPGEFAKICLVVFFVSYLAERRTLLGLAEGVYRQLAPVLFGWALALIVLVFEKDLGSALLVFTSFLAVIYAATGRTSFVALGAVAFVGAATVSYRLFEHVRERVLTWLDPWSDFLGDGFQIGQSVFAFGTGGLLGTGLGEGRPDLIPLAETDFIFAAIGEELGFVGTMAVLVGFVGFCGLGLAIGSRHQNEFPKLLAVGLAAGFGIQALVTLGGVTRLLPLTGITLPFVSYGGSSLLANFVLLAILLMVSHEANSHQALVEAAVAGRPVDAAVEG